MTTTPSTRRGFTLIEMMIVVAIIAVVASLAMPSLLKSRMSANEVSARKSLLVIRTSQELYWKQHNEFASEYGNLYTSGHLVQRDVSEANAVNGAASATPKSGYVFASNPNYSGYSFMAVAAPVNSGVSGEWMMFINEEATVYVLNADGDEDADTLLAPWIDDADDWDPDLWEVAPD